jgi:hypothetical protein
MSPLPLGRPRKYSWRQTVTHDQHLIIDPQRVELGRASVGVTRGPFYGVFGTPNAVLHSMPRRTARVLAFPGWLRGEIVTLRAELEEIRRTMSVR